MHPKLILSLSGEVLQEIDLDQEITTIGRKAINDIHLDNLAVSGTHAKILLLGGDCFLEDLESTNGTYVNGDRVTKHVLKDGDKIAIGKHEFLYQNEAATAENEEDFEKTMILKPYATGMGGESMTPQAEKPESAPEPQEASGEQTSEVKAALQLLSGTNVGKRLTLSKPLTRLGKPGAQVAAIQMRSNGCYVFNIPGSGKAPSLNGKDLGAKAVLLKDGDLLEVGNVRMKYVQS
ncbi:MAG: FHA domain-containing protein [Porticoccaceae bacterium]